MNGARGVRAALGGFPALGSVATWRRDPGGILSAVEDTDPTRVAAYNPPLSPDQVTALSEQRAYLQNTLIPENEQTIASFYTAMQNQRRAIQQQQTLVDATRDKRRAWEQVLVQANTPRKRTIAQSQITIVQRELDDYTERLRDLRDGADGLRETKQEADQTIAQARNTVRRITNLLERDAVYKQQEATEKYVQASEESADLLAEVEATQGLTPGAYAAELSAAEERLARTQTQAEQRLRAQRARTRRNLRNLGIASVVLAGGAYLLGRR